VALNPIMYLLLRGYNQKIYKTNNINKIMIRLRQGALEMLFGGALLVATLGVAIKDFYSHQKDKDYISPGIAYALGATAGTGIFIRGKRKTDEDISQEFIKSLYPNLR
jgi:hypothetical protein